MRTPHAPRHVPREGRARLRLLALLLPPLALAAPEAPAQVTLGLKGGVNIAKLSAENADGTDPGFTSRTTLGGGAWLQAGLGDVIALQVEGLYTPRGGRARDGGSLKLSYVDVPALFLVRVPAGESAIWPILYAGPVYSFETGCDVELAGGESAGCGSAPAPHHTRDRDLGAAVGGGLEVFLGRYTLQLDVRYTHGLRDLEDGPEETAASLRNRTWSFQLGLGRVLTP